jgi:aspartokinase
MQRHFFTTSHGKGPYDGVGGSVKRHVKRASVQIIGKHVHTLVGILTTVWRTLQEYNLFMYPVKTSKMKK